MIWWVSQRWTGEACLGKELQIEEEQKLQLLTKQFTVILNLSFYLVGFWSLAKINSFASWKQIQSIEKLEDLTARLVNWRDDSPAISWKTPKCLGNEEGRSAAVFISKIT